MPPQQACRLHLAYSQLMYTVIFFSRVTPNPSVARIELIPEVGPYQTTTIAIGKEVMVVYCHEDQ